MAKSSLALVAVAVFCAAVFEAEACALTLDPFWVLADENYQKFVEVRCARGEKSLCRSLCQRSSTCRVEEHLCKNCVGSDIYITNLFKEMGRTYVNSSMKVRKKDVVRLLKSGDFLTLTSDSILNHVERYDDPVLQERFGSLCWGREPRPVVVIKKHSDNNKLLEVKYVLCGGTAYQMDDTAIVVFGD